MERVRLHPYYTERVLGRSQALAPLALLAGSHHERLDGSGYHRGAAAAQLGVGARLLAAADAFDAMTHDRPHRHALGPEQARDELGVMVGAGAIEKRVADAVLEAAGSAPTETRQGYPAGLTEREIEVLRLLAQGKTNREIAEALVITEKTAGHHVEHIYAKADVSTRVGAALFAMRHDLVERHNTGKAAAARRDGAFTRCRGDRGRLGSRSRDRDGEEGVSMPETEANGVRHYCEIHGGGEPLVLVHGSWVDATRWRLVVPGLAELFRVLAYDRRGHSRSERPDAPGSVDEDGDDLAALLETLDLAPAHVVTNSYGGNIALRLATRRPEIFRSLSCHEPPLWSLLEGDPEGQEILQHGARSLDAVGRRIAAGDHEGAARQFVEEVAFGPVRGRTSYRRR